MNRSTFNFEQLLQKLLATLGAQKELFGQATQIEEKKNEAILTRDGESLQSLTREEEVVLKELDLKEQARYQLLEEMAQETGQKQPEKLAAILDWPQISEEMKVRLDKEAGDLVDIIFQMQSMSRLNQAMITDNNEMFRAVISSLNAEPEFGYHETEQNKNIHKRKKPLFVDVGC